jgi:nucleoside 2-deoxyribosyltransferase
MHIYFAGSIRGGRDDADLYAELVEQLQGYGTVLTEHVGDEDLSDEGQEEASDHMIYVKDMDWLERADVVVAEVTTPSLGVGYELGRAEAAGTDILCLFRDDADVMLSAMISGNPDLPVVRYTDLDGAREGIRSFFEDR